MDTTTSCHCPGCDALLRIEPTHPLRRTSCPACGTLLWFLQTSHGLKVYEEAAIGTLRDKFMALVLLHTQIRINPADPSRSFSQDIDVGSLDLVELVMEL